MRRAIVASFADHVHPIVVARWAMLSSGAPWPPPMSRLITSCRIPPMSVGEVGELGAVVVGVDTVEGAGAAGAAAV